MEFLGIFLSRKRHGKKKKHSRSFVSAWFSVSGKRDSNPRPPAWKASALFGNEKLRFPLLRLSYHRFTLT